MSVKNQNERFCPSVISWREQVTCIQWNDDEVRFVLDHSLLSHTQQSPNSHAAPLGHIILIPNQSVFVLTPESCVLSGKAANTNCIVFCSTRPESEPTIYRTRGKHANQDTTDAIEMYPMMTILSIISVLHEHPIFTHHHRQIWLMLYHKILSAAIWLEE